jgi:hypothetical protein
VPTRDGRLSIRIKLQRPKPKVCMSSDSMSTDHSISDQECQ